MEAIHPGRIDLAIGRAPGTDGLTARALRRAQVDVDEFIHSYELLADLFPDSIGHDTTEVH